MGKYLKQSFVRKLEIDYSRDEITHSRMVELIEEEVIKNYTKENGKEINTGTKEGTSSN
jgi:hypothetical protein